MRRQLRPVHGRRLRLERRREGRSAPCATSPARARPRTSRASRRRCARPSATPTRTSVGEQQLRLHPVGRHPPDLQRRHRHSPACSAAHRIGRRRATPRSSNGKNPIWNRYGHERMGWALSTFNPADALTARKARHRGPRRSGPKRTAPADESGHGAHPGSTSWWRLTSSPAACVWLDANPRRPFPTPAARVAAQAVRRPPPPRRAGSPGAPRWADSPAPRAAASPCRARLPAAAGIARHPHLIVAGARSERRLDARHCDSVNQGERPTMAEVIERLHRPASGGPRRVLAARHAPAPGRPRRARRFALPEGYVRHYQATDDGQRIEPILMFSPDHEFVDAANRPIAIPKDRVVPPGAGPARDCRSGAS